MTYTLIIHREDDDGTPTAVCGLDTWSVAGMLVDHLAGLRDDITSLEVVHHSREPRKLRRLALAEVAKQPDGSLRPTS
jgi:hypothetical protein